QKRVGVGLGWDLREHRGVPLVVHNGRYEGASALIGLMPSRRAGVVVLANRGGISMFAAEAIAAELYDLLLGVEPADVTARLLAMAAPELATSDRRDSTVRARLSAPASAYAGRYEHPDWGPLSVATRGPELSMKLGTMPLPLAFGDVDAFEADRSYPGWFERDTRGRVIGVRLVLEAPDTARFVRQ
ncbi:MAG: hypothetical protein HOP12_15260, partial [Candidatus Eisenbacteria bacterium]|nr:hypothetical protein [Candidatus Eisenbacteria bacterium]